MCGKKMFTNDLKKNIYILVNLQFHHEEFILIYCKIFTITLKRACKNKTDSQGHKYFDFHKSEHSCNDKVTILIPQKGGVLKQIEQCQK